MTSDSDLPAGFVRREFGRARAVVARFGGRAALGKAIAYPRRLAAARVNYWTYRRRYPTNVVFVASLAKSGSTWLAGMLAALPGFDRYQPSGWTAAMDTGASQDVYPGLFAEVRRRLAVIKGHTPGTIENVSRLQEAGVKYLITVRDPRDQIISGYWYLRNRPHHPAHRLAMTLSLDEFVSHELDPGTASVPRAAWLRKWLQNRDPDHSHIVRYEDLLQNPLEEMRRICDFLGFEVGSELLEAIVLRHSFTAISGRAPGQEDRTSFLRRGVAGEWKESFSPEQRDLARRHVDDVAVALGYEPTDLQP